MLNKLYNSTVFICARATRNYSLAFSFVQQPLPAVMDMNIRHTKHCL